MCKLHAAFQKLFSVRSASGWGSIASFADGTRRRFFSARQPGIGKQRQTLTERRNEP